MPKNIVMCFDGTGNEPKARGNTNVVRLYEMLSLGDPAEQIAYYDPGVGTFGAQGALLPQTQWITRKLGLAFGYGVRTNLAEAYTFLMNSYRPRDRVYLFGFSRGAFTARAFAGLVNRVGLLRAGAENLVPYALKMYARRRRRWTPDDWQQTAVFADTFAAPINGEPSLGIHFLGLWDSVKAAGVLRGKMNWPDTRRVPNVAHVRHAVSIDEKRRPYREYLIDPRSRARVEEVWFAGVHSDVGGTFVDDHGLADISLRWMVQGAVAAGLGVKPRALERLTVGSKEALGTIHRMGWVWALLTYRRRPLAGDARVHASVRERLARDPSYRLRVPETSLRWEDPEWAAGEPPGPASP